MHHSCSYLFFLCRVLVVAAFASAATYLQLEDAIKRGYLAEQVSLQQLVQQHALPWLPAQLAAPAQQAGEAAQQLLASAWPAAAQLVAMLASQPLRELLPHATYALCGTAAALWLAAVATGRLRGGAAAAAAAQLVLAVLVQVSERGAPLILLLALLQLAAMARPLARRAELQGRSGAAGVAGEAAAMVALVAAQLFYATGHMCEFAGLQYTAGAEARASVQLCWLELRPDAMRLAVQGCAQHCTLAALCLVCSFRLFFKKRSFRVLPQAPLQHRCPFLPQALLGPMSSPCGAPARLWP